MWTAIIAAMVAITGWLVAHVLALRAQKRQFLLQVSDRARQEISREIHAYIGWLIALTNRTRWVRTFGDDGSAGSLAGRRYDLSEMNKLLSTNAVSLGWWQRLDDYIVLFPNTEAVLKELSARQNILLMHLETIANALTATPEGASAPTEIRALADRLGIMATDQADLMSDLNRHLQNITFSKLVGRESRTRSTYEANSPEIKMGSNGYLEIAWGTLGRMDGTLVQQPNTR